MTEPFKTLYSSLFPFAH